MTFEKFHSAKKLIKSSVVLERLNSRKRYVNSLIHRLRHVPQILPIGNGFVCRTRLDHCNNIVGIVAATAFQPEQKFLQKKLMIASMMHDIGHAPFGHASERAINTWLKKEYFSNDMQSSRLLFFSMEEHGQERLPIFQTTPMQKISDIRPPADPLATAAGGDRPVSASYKSSVLDFLDDLENVVGDTGDLCRNGMAETGRAAKELGIPPRFEVGQTVSIADQVLRRFGKDRSLQSLLNLVSDDTAMNGLLQEARNEVMAARLASLAIERWDHAAQLHTTDICNAVSTELNRDQTMSDASLVDIIASITIA